MVLAILMTFIFSPDNSILFSLKAIYSPKILAGLQSIPRQMPTALVDGHFGGLELVQLLANGGLVLWRQSCPRLVRPPIVVVGLRDLDVVVEPDDLLLLQLFDGRPKAEFAQQIRLLLLLLLLLLGG